LAQDSSKSDFWESRYRDHVTPWDAGKVPDALRNYAKRIKSGSRILIPGCGSAYEAGYLVAHRFDVLAIDFSPAAVELAKKNLSRFGDIVKLADFFEFDYGTPYDVIYERAFLCALPRAVWPRWASRVAELVRPGGELAGFFYIDDNQRGPPFGVSQEGLNDLLGKAFEMTESRVLPPEQSLPVFQGKEIWQVWKRRL